MTATAERDMLTWATGGPYPHDYQPRTAGGHGCDPCHGCGKRPEAGARIWMNCYHDLYCDPCARRNDAAWHAQRHPFERPIFGDTYCARCGAKRDGEQHRDHEQAESRARLARYARGDVGYRLLG